MAWPPFAACPRDVPSWRDRPVSPGLRVHDPNSRSLSLLRPAFSDSDFESARDSSCACSRSNIRAAGNSGPALSFSRRGSRDLDIAKDNRLRRTSLRAGGRERIARNRVLSDAPAFTCAAIFASSMRCTQKVHFSITPRMRTVTFGFFCIFVRVRRAFLVSGREVFLIDANARRSSSCRPAAGCNRNN